MDDAGIAKSLDGLMEARSLLISALSVLDEIPVVTGCDCHVDYAIHMLTGTIDQVRTGNATFRA